MQTPNRRSSRPVRNTTREETPAERKSARAKRTPVTRRSSRLAAKAAEGQVNDLSNRELPQPKRRPSVGGKDNSNAHFLDDNVYENPNYQTPAHATPKSKTPMFSPWTSTNDTELITSKHTILELSKLNAHLQQRVGAQQQQLYICTFVALAMLASLLASMIYPLIEPQKSTTSTVVRHEPSPLMPNIDERDLLFCADEGLVDQWLHSTEGQLDCCIRSPSDHHDCLCIRQGFELLEKLSGTVQNHNVNAEADRRIGGDYLKHCSSRLKGVHSLTASYFLTIAYRLLNDPWTAYDTLADGMRTAERSFGLSIQQLYDRLGSEVITFSRQTPQTLLCFRIGLDDHTCETAGSRVLEARYRDARQEFDRMLDGADINYARKVRFAMGDAWIAYTQALQ